MRLIDRFNPLFALAVDIHSFPVTTENKDALKEAVYHAVAKEQAAQASSGISLDDMDLARTAVYFFMDEVLMDEEIPFSSNPNEQNTINLAWYQNSLQNTFLNTEKGGELFFLYFEQILNKILAFTPQNTDMNLAHQGIQNFSSPVMQAFPSLSLHDKFLRVSQLLAGTFEPQQIEKTQEAQLSQLAQSSDNTNSDLVSAFETLEVYAKCLLYGFRGKYYDPAHHAFLQEIRNTAFTFLQIKSQDTEELDSNMLLETPKHASLAQPLHRKTKLGYFFYIACPPLLCAIWYFYCAQTVSQILL